jgi:hypothetical protein
MGCTVRELGVRLSSAEMVDWLAYSLIEPFGQPRADDIGRSIIASAWQVAGSRVAQPRDFLKTWRPQAEIDDDAKLASLIGWLDAKAEGGD